MKSQAFLHLALKLRASLFLIVLFIFLLPHLAKASENKTKATPQPSQSSKKTAPTRYIFASIPLSPYFFEVPCKNSDSPSEDPFGANDISTQLAKIKKIFYTVIQNPPQCLLNLHSSHTDYYNIAPLLRVNGIDIKSPEWALLSLSSSNSYTLYFCATQKNADIIKEAFQVCTPRPPQRINLTASIISIPHQNIQNPAWTAEYLKTLHPTLHARYGNISESGEKSNINLYSPGLSSSTPLFGCFEFEPTVGSSAKLLDLHLRFNTNIPNTFDNLEAPQQAGISKKEIQLSGETSITLNNKVPFIIDCGTHGTKQRNFFIVLYPSIIPLLSQANHSYTILATLDQISGIYSLPSLQTRSLKNSILSDHSKSSNQVRLGRTRIKLISVNLRKNPIFNNKPWTIEEIEKSSPKLIKTFSTIAQSGTKSKLQFSSTPTEHPQKNKIQIRRHSNNELTTELTLGDFPNSSIIDNRFSLNFVTQKKLTLSLSTALTLSDGKPVIFEIGNPLLDPEAPRTYLLVIYSDLVRPDGSFCRDSLIELPSPKKNKN